MKKLLFRFFFVLFVLGVLATPSFAKEGSVDTKDSLIEKQIKYFEKSNYFLLFPFRLFLY
ncbi:hypothetical protein [Paraliobacillus sp. JSM ZJ581]|uniref:hypothetical protein n=1 Tax=Paraliobacillus sp. JSM ZJ581 TaxID=3342118 RepID=UPI0035A8B9C7